MARRCFLYKEMMDIPSVPSLMSFQFISWKYHYKTKLWQICVSVLTPDVSRLEVRSLLCHWGRRSLRLGSSLADWLWSWGNDKVSHHISQYQSHQLFLSRLLFLAFLANCIDMMMATCPMGSVVKRSHNQPHLHSQLAKASVATNSYFHPNTNIIRYHRFGRIWKRINANRLNYSNN